MKKSRPRIIDVAKVARVSAATVSNVLNATRHVDPATRDRVTAAVARLGYVPDLRARRLRTGQIATIAILSSMPFAVAAGPSRLGFLMEIAAVAAAVAMEQGVALVLVPPAEFKRAPIEQLDVNGVIVVEPVQDDPEVARLRARGIAVVTIGRQLNDREDIPFVDLQSALTARLMLDHLLAQGGRQIALISGRQPRNSYQETEKEYVAFARRHKMTLRLLRLDETQGEAAARLACRALLTEHPEVDALCVPVDAFATGAVQAAADLGRAIPGDLKIITRYDGLRARESRPQLSAIDLHLADLAGIAVKLLLDRLNGQGGKARHCGPPPRVIRRESSGC
ncbi:MAG: putative rane protein [Tardiphaga sp.]|nr:putative rane protein [Tardiphaga sp.]